MINTLEVSIFKDDRGSCAVNELKKQSHTKVRGKSENNKIKETARVEQEKEKDSLEAREVTQMNNTSIPPRKIINRI